MPGYVKMGTRPTLPTGGLLQPGPLPTCVLKPWGSWEMRPGCPSAASYGAWPSASTGQLPAPDLGSTMRVSGLSLCAWHIAELEAGAGAGPGWGCGGWPASSTHLALGQGSGSSRRTRWRWRPLSRTSPGRLPQGPLAQRTHERGEPPSHPTPHCHQGSQPEQGTSHWGHSRRAGRHLRTQLCEFKRDCLPLCAPPLSCENTSPASLAPTSMN